MVFPEIVIRPHSVAMKTIRRSNERGHVNHGWLDSYFTFSFADYYDPQWLGFRSLRVINDDLILPGMGFGAHPHRDMEIISYVLAGQLQHRDSMGNGRVIKPGEFQYMAAGSGVEHGEFNPSKTEATRLLQIWIKPDAKGVKPRYAERNFTKAETGKLHLVASKAGREGSFEIHQDADLLLGKLEVGQTVEHTFGKDRHAWVHIAEGEVVINGETLVGGDALAVSDEKSLNITANKPSQVLLFDLN